MTGPIVRVKTQEVCAVTFQSMSAQYYKQVTVESLNATYAVTQDVLRKFPGKYCVLTIAPATQVPSDAARKRAAELMNLVGPQTVLGITVLEGTGFAASAGRAVMTGIQLLTKQRTYVQFENTIEGAAKRLALKMTAILGTPVSYESVLETAQLAIDTHHSSYST